VARGGGVDGAFFAPFLWRFHGCFGAVLKVKWCRFGDKTSAIFRKKVLFWVLFGCCFGCILLGLKGLHGGYFWR